jgi:hypothetical protein
LPSQRLRAACCGPDVPWASSQSPHLEFYLEMRILSRFLVLWQFSLRCFVVIKICLFSALRECLSTGRQVMAYPQRSEEKIAWDAGNFRDDVPKKKPNWARTKLEAAFWVILSLVAISACDLKNVLLYDDRVHRWALIASCWCICVNWGILIYLNL